MPRTAGGSQTDTADPSAPLAVFSCRRSADIVLAGRGQGWQGGPDMIEARGLTKKYGDTVAVDNLSFTVEPGRITGFLGPNGAGKTTTMRLILGLDRPTRGTVTVDGKPFGRHPWPMREIGALLDAKAVHGGRSADNHLLCVAPDNKLPPRRIGQGVQLGPPPAVPQNPAHGLPHATGQP